MEYSKIMHGSLIGVTFVVMCSWCMEPSKKEKRTLYDDDCELVQLFHLLTIADTKHQLLKELEKSNKPNRHLNKIRWQIQLCTDEKNKKACKKVVDMLSFEPGTVNEKSGLKASLQQTGTLMPDQQSMRSMCKKEYEFSDLLKVDYFCCKLKERKKRQNPSQSFFKSCLNKTNLQKNADQLAKEMQIMVDQFHEVREQCKQQK